MPKGFVNESNSNAPGEFPKCEKGRYKIVAVEFANQDESGQLIWKASQKGMTTLLRFLREDGGISPVMSMTAMDLLLLTIVTGGSVSALPKDRNTSAYLVKAQEQIKKGGKPFYVNVNGEQGWVSNIEGAIPPEGYYYFKFVGAQTWDKSDPIRVQRGRVGDKESIMLIFEIAGDMLGKPSPYNGFQTTAFLNDPFDGSKDGLPVVRLNTSGGATIDWFKLSKFSAAYCPEVMDHDWVSAELSDYGVDEYNYPLEVYVKSALANDYRAMGQFTKSTRSANYKLDLMTLAAVDAPAIDAIEEVAEETNDLPTHEFYVEGGEFATEHPYLCELALWIYRQFPGAFKTVPIETADQLVLTDAGIKWAPENLGKIWLAADLKPGAVPISKITEEDAEKLVKKLPVPAQFS